MTLALSGIMQFFSGNKVITLPSPKVPKHLMGYGISGQKLTEGGVLIASQPLMDPIRALHLPKCEL